jgi:hypothetical protein
VELVLLPAGQALRYSGRDRGDLVIRLLTDIPKIEPKLLEPILVPERLTRPHPVIAALKQTPGRLRVSKNCMGRQERHT